MNRLRIGDLADRTGTSAPTIRYDEEIGLLRPAARDGGGQRVYAREDVDRLTFIRRCREFGFPIEPVKTLVAVTHDPNSSCMIARDMATEHLDAVRAKLRELKALERSPVAFVKPGETSCAGGPAPECLILEELGSACGCASSDSRRAR